MIYGGLSYDLGPALRHPITFLSVGYSLSKRRYAPMLVLRYRGTRSLGCVYQLSFRSLRTCSGLSPLSYMPIPQSTHLRSA